MKLAALRTSPSLFVAVALAAAAGTASCSSDPTLSNSQKRLGGEIEGIPKGEYHRAGQPCVVCHNSKGPGKGDFSVAGTVFLAPATDQNRTLVGVDQVQILLVDSAGVTKRVNTNCVGNFYVSRKEWNPKFPLKVSIYKSGFDTVPMNSLIGRDGSCAACHNYDRAPDSAGNVYLSTDPNAKYTPPDDCPVEPTIELEPLDDGTGEAAQ